MHNFCVSCTKPRSLATSVQLIQTSPRDAILSVGLGGIQDTRWKLLDAQMVQVSAQKAL
jgi:hypothetical protein